MSFLNLIVKCVEWVLIVLFGVMAILVFANVVLRYGFNSGIVFTEEVSRFLFMWLTLIGALVVMKDNAHLGMNSVVAALGDRGRRICRLIADVLTLVCCLLLAHGTWTQMVLGMDELAPVTGWPLGIVQSCLLISSVGMALVLSYSLWRLVTGRMKPEEVVPQSGNGGE